MKITGDQLKAIKRLVPGWTFSAPEGFLEYKTFRGGDWYLTTHSMYCDYFLGELKRAVRALPEVRCIKTSDGSRGFRITLYDGKPLVPIIDANNELEAWILAVEELHGRLGNV